VGEVIAVFDANILMDYLDGVHDALEELRRYSVKEISIVTWMEVLTGAKPNDEAYTRSLLGTCVVLPVTQEIAERAVFERRQRRIKLPDAIVIATAIVGGRVLVTRNTRDFPADDEHVRIPYRLRLH